MEKTQITPYTRQEILLDNIAKAIESGGEGSTDISPYTRREILLNNIAKAIENRGGGGGGGTPDIIRGTMSQDDENIIFTLDKTYQECVNLINNGVNSIYITTPYGAEIFQITSFQVNNLVMPPVYVIYILLKSPTNEAVFSSFSASTENDYPTLRLSNE